jgi:hypothetical protein
MAKIDPNEPCPCGSGKTFGDCHGPRVITNRPIVISQRIPLKVIPEPDPGSRSVFIQNGKESIVFSGRETEISLDCGQCGASLVVGLKQDQIRNIVLKCNQCGAFNDTE